MATRAANQDAMPAMAIESELARTQQIMGVVGRVVRMRPTTLGELTKSRIEAIKQVAATTPKPDGSVDAAGRRKSISLNAVLDKCTRQMGANTTNFDQQLWKMVEKGYPLNPTRVAAFRDWLQNRPLSPNGAANLVQAFATAAEQNFNLDAVEAWPREAPFEIGRRIHGTVSQASLLDFVELRRTSTGQQGRKEAEGPDKTRDGLCELLRRLTNADVSVTKVVSLPAKKPEAQLVIPPLPARSSDDEVANYAGRLLAEHAKYAPSEDSAFRLVTDSTDFNRVLALLNATQPVVKSDWSRLAAFAHKSKWTSHVQARLCCKVILEGVPGTGKTYALKELAKKSGNRNTIAVGRLATVMHPATSYEDFVEGLRPGAPKTSPSGAKTVTLLMSAEEDPFPIDLEPAAASSDQSSPVWFFQPSATSSSSGFSIHDGFFVAACAEAVRNPNTPYVVLLDELNRCNIPKVMGDLITTMEISKRAKWKDQQWDLSSAQVVTLPYSKRQFFVPDNLTIVGTMNTTDRSVAPMDAALRRRFVFVRMEPEFERFASTPVSAAATKLIQLNKALEAYLGPDAILGHSYLDDMQREIDAGGDAAAVTRFYFEKVIFPMVVDTLVNNGCLAELYEAHTAKGDALSGTPAGVFLKALYPIAEVYFSGRGMTQTLRLEWKAPSPNAAEKPTPKSGEGANAEGPANDDVAVDRDV